MASQERSTGAVSARKLWFGVLGGHAAWTLHLLLSYFVVSIGCLPGVSIQILGVDGFVFLINALTTLFAVVAAAAALVAFSVWQRREELGGRERLMAFLGFVLSGLFFGAILFEGIPTLFLDPCVNVP